MKRKVIYLVAFMFCLSYLSMAKQAGKNCDRDVRCPSARAVPAKQSQASSTKQSGFDRLPFRIFIFSI